MMEVAIFMLAINIWIGADNIADAIKELVNKISNDDNDYEDEDD